MVGIATLALRFLDPSGFIAIVVLFVPIVDTTSAAGIPPLVLTAALLIPSVPFWATYQNIWVAMGEGITEGLAFSGAERVRLATMYAVFALFTVAASIGLLEAHRSFMMRIGFVGFGEAAYHIAKGLRQPGISSITAFDINVTDKVRQRAQETGTRLVDTNRELAESCDILMSAVTADQALIAAEQNAPYLTAIASLRGPELRLAGREAIHRARHRSVRRTFCRDRDDGAGSAVRPQSADAGGRRTARRNSSKS